MALLDDIEAFLETHEISATAFGHQALGDRHFVRQLRMGRRVWPETEGRVREFMEGFVSLHGAADTANSEQVSTGKNIEDFPYSSPGSSSPGAADPGGDGSASGESLGGEDLQEAAE